MIPPHEYPRLTPDFSPKSIIFKARDHWNIIVSDIGVALTFAALGYWGYKRSFTEVLVIYVLPYLWVNQ